MVGIEGRRTQVGRPTDFDNHSLYVVAPPRSTDGAEGGPTGAGAHRLPGSDEESPATEIPPVVEVKAGEKPHLIGGRVQGDAIAACHRNSGQMTGAEPDDPLLASALEKIDVHQAGGTGHGCLAAEFRSGGGGDLEAVAPGHGDGLERPLTKSDSNRWGAPQEAPTGPMALRAGTSPSPWWTDPATPRPLTV